MKPIKLWGGIADGVEVGVSEEFYDKRQPIVWASPHLPPASFKRDRPPNAVWDELVGNPIQHNRYDHHEIRGNYDHPCVKGLRVSCRWDFWSKDLAMNQFMVDRVTHAQRPDDVIVIVTPACPFVR